MLRRAKSALLLPAVVVACVLVPFLFWRQSWFGRPLDDENLARYLEENEKPRQIQHALVQIAERIARGDPDVGRWYDKILELADHPLVEIRTMVAWVMGQEGRIGEFRHRLHGMLQDREPLVRRNAALALVRFGAPSGREELLAMLRPYRVTSPAGGVLSFALNEGDPVSSGALLGQVTLDDGRRQDVMAPVPGKLKTLFVAGAARVDPGDEIASLAPGAEHVWESLRALYIVGEGEDLESVEPFISNPQFSERIQRQARLTAEAIQTRAIRGQSTLSPNSEQVR